jgi:hypothetical protein
MRTELTVTALPPCEMCRDGTKARYEARISRLQGSWCYVCQSHFASYGPGRLAIGHGHRLVVGRG